jgi:predicted Zn-dependent protease
MSFQQYDDFMKSNKRSDNKVQTQRVKRVGNRIKDAVEDYFAEQNNSQVIADYRWEFNLIESDQVNAWCMPGGKVVVYEGILPVAENEAGLAVVMGHEIAHAVARHGNERMSQALVTQLGGMALSKALEEKPEQTQMLWMAAFGIGTQVGFLLPYSRLHESEADRLGLIFMSIAGYHPQNAVAFWQRMAEQKSQPSPPEFLSTHPSDQTRIKNLREIIPSALEYYRE